MRIITGSARGTKLEAPAGLGTRPTSDRAKEAIFSILQFELTGKKVLDLFAGSGQLALEALSRGAESACLVDSDPAACEVIKRNARKTRLFPQTRVLCCDFKAALRAFAGKETFSLLFLDPPYKSDFLDTALPLLPPVTAEGGFLVLESDRPEPFSLPGFSLFRHVRYGKAVITLLKKDPVFGA